MFNKYVWHWCFSFHRLRFCKRRWREYEESDAMAFEPGGYWEYLSDYLKNIEAQDYIERWPAA